MPPTPPLHNPAQPTPLLRKRRYPIALLSPASMRDASPPSLSPSTLALPPPRPLPQSCIPPYHCPSAQKTIISAAYPNTGYPLAPARIPRLRRCALTPSRASPRDATPNINTLPLRTTPLTRSPLLFKNVGAFSPHVRSNQRPPPATPPPLQHLPGIHPPPAANTTFYPQAA
jgi:hypothetical protein